MTLLKHPQTILNASERTIAFKPIYFHILKSRDDALFLSQAVWWTVQNRGWFYHTQWQWLVELGFNNRQQLRVRNRLKKRNLLSEKFDRTHRLMYRVDMVTLSRMIREYRISLDSRIDEYLFTNQTNQQHKAKVIRITRPKKQL